MKVLWFTNTSSLYKRSISVYNGGGWIESLEYEVRQEKKINLAVSFFYSGKAFKEIQDDVVYYPLTLYKTLIKKIFFKVFLKKRIQAEVKLFLEVVNDFKPDLIHVFGSERSFGLIKKYVNIPVVLHIQGILSPYLNAWYPPGYCFCNYVFSLNFIENFFRIKEFFSFQKNSEREKEIFSLIGYYMGRTDWDKRVSKLLAPNSNYFYVSEILRQVFYESKQWEHHEKVKVILSTTISKPLYKGLDLILKTAELLTKTKKLDFEWNVFGNVDVTYAEKKTSIKIKDVNIIARGVVSAEDLVDSLLNSDIFIHPSYIDNSPNSICEAQLLGVPVVSTNVGGISSLIEDGVTGILVPANDPYYLTSKIIELVFNPKQMISIGNSARLVAHARHNREKILEDLLNAYTTIVT